LKKDKKIIWRVKNVILFNQEQAYFSFSRTGCTGEKP